MDVIKSKNGVPPQINRRKTDSYYRRAFRDGWLLILKFLKQWRSQR
jgi:hypothetical protein